MLFLIIIIPLEICLFQSIFILSEYWLSYFYLSCVYASEVLRIGNIHRKNNNDSDN